METKMCLQCMIEKDEYQFSPSPLSFDGYSDYCKECHREYCRGYSKSNPEKVKRSHNKR